LTAIFFSLISLGVFTILGLGTPGTLFSFINFLLAAFSSFFNLISSYIISGVFAELIECKIDQ
jgi:hypothetical protein